MSIKIIGTGSYLPSIKVTNRELEKIVDTSDEWIRSRTGISSRFISSGETTTEMAVAAARKALNMAGKNPEEIDLILTATLSGDYHTPSTACLVQAEIGAKHAICFDLNAACSGFLFSLNTAEAYMRTGMAKHILVIGAECLSKIIDWNDRSSCILFGDGAGAVVLSCEEKKEYEAVLHSDGLGGRALTCEEVLISNPYTKVDREPQKVKMDGQAIFKFAVKNVPVCIREVLEKADVSLEEVKYFILHQANERIIDSIAKKLKVSVEKFPMNVAECGNTSSASIPILLDEMNRAGMLQRGDKIVLSGFGGGLTWGAAYLEW